MTYLPLFKPSFLPQTIAEENLWGLDNWYRSCKCFPVIQSTASKHCEKRETANVSQLITQSTSGKTKQHSYSKSVSMAVTKSCCTKRLSATEVDGKWIRSIGEQDSGSVDSEVLCSNMQRCSTIKLTAWTVHIYTTQCTQCLQECSVYIQSYSSMHHYECIALCKDISLQKGRFCTRSPASCIPRSSKDRSSWICFVQVVRGRPGGRLQFPGEGLKMAWLASAFSSIRARCPKKVRWWDLMMDKVVAGW